MFKILSIVFFLFSGAEFAQSRTMPESNFLEDAQLIPHQLKLEGDSIRFVIKGSIPILSALSPKNPRVTLSFKGESNQLDLGEVNLKKNVSNYAYEDKFALKYEPWMEGAILELYFFQGKNENRKAYEKKILTRGVVAPHLLVRLGTIYPHEPIFPVGLFMTSGVLARNIVNVGDFQLLFDLGTSTYKSTEANRETFEKIDAFLKSNLNVQKIKITGIQSPEQEEGKSRILGLERAESAKQALGIRIQSLPDSMIVVESRSDDWFDLRLLLREYKGIASEYIEELYAIFMSEETYLDQYERLIKVPGFSQVSQDLFPSLRAAKIQITATPRMGLDFQQSIKLKEALEKSDGTNGLTRAEWLLAAESNPSLEEKAAIYSKMTEFYRSAEAYNNMAVIRMRQAQQTLDHQSQEILWDEAQRLLNLAYQIEPNPYIIHNQGQIMVFEGNYWDAYVRLSEATSKLKDDELLKTNEALRGALDILRGDYKLATLRFGYEYSNPRDYFNKGLAFYLIEDYPKANLAFEQSVEMSRTYGYGYYGLAMIAVSRGQKEVAIVHLKKAIESNRQLADRVFRDPIFEQVRNNSEFFQGISRN